MHAPKPFTLRPAQPAEACAVIATLHDTFESTWRPNITPSAAQAFRDEDRPAAYFAARGHKFWVCESADGVVGFVDWQDDFVNALHVRRVQARSGVGYIPNGQGRGRDQAVWLHSHKA